MSQLRIRIGSLDPLSISEQTPEKGPCFLQRLSTTLSPTTATRKASISRLQAIGEERSLSSKSSQSQLSIKSERRKSMKVGIKVRSSAGITKARMPKRQSIYLRTTEDNISGVEQCGSVKEMVHIALRGSSRLQSLKHQLGENELVSEALDMRVTHVRGMASTELDITTVKYRDQLLFICACLSLAQDFQEYQRRCDSKQRDQKVDGSIPLLAGTAAGHHDQQLPNFVASQAPLNEKERSDLEGAVLLGIKIRVIDAIGHSLNLGKGLGLLCAFERQRLTSLPTKALPHLRKILMEDTLTANRIRVFSAAIGPWWTVQTEEYQKSYTSVAGSLPRRSLDSWSPIKHVRAASRKISFSPVIDQGVDTSGNTLEYVESLSSVQDFGITLASVTGKGEESLTAASSPTLRSVDSWACSMPDLRLSRKDSSTSVNTMQPNLLSPISSPVKSVKPWSSVRDLRLTFENAPWSTTRIQPPRSTRSPSPACPELVQSSPSTPSTRCSSRTSRRSSSRSPNCSPIIEDDVGDEGYSPITVAGSPITQTLSPTSYDSDSNCFSAIEKEVYTPREQTVQHKRSTLRSENPHEFSTRRQGLLVSRYTIETIKAGKQERQQFLSPYTSPSTPDPFTDQNPFDSDFAISRPRSRLSNRSPTPTIRSPRTCSPSPMSPSPRARSPIPIDMNNKRSNTGPSPSTPFRNNASSPAPPSRPPPPPPPPSQSRAPSRSPTPTADRALPPPPSSHLRSATSNTSLKLRSRTSTASLAPLSVNNTNSSGIGKLTRAFSAPANHIAAQWTSFTDPSRWVKDAQRGSPYRSSSSSTPQLESLVCSPTASSPHPMASEPRLALPISRLAATATHSPSERLEAQIDELLTGLQRQMADAAASRERRGKGVGAGLGMGMGVRNGVTFTPLVAGLKVVKEEIMGVGADGVRVVDWSGSGNGGCY